MQVLILTLDNQKYCIKTEFIELIDNKKVITPIPKSPKYAKGVINLKGRILSVLDIKGILDLDSNNEEENLVVLNIKGERFGILVDLVEEILEISEEEIITHLGKALIKHNNNVVTMLEEADFINVFQSKV